jgi:hypothetical protein
MAALAAWSGMAAAQSPLVPQGSPYLPAPPTVSIPITTPFTPAPKSTPAPNSTPVSTSAPASPLPSITSVPGSPSQAVNTVTATAAPATSAGPERIVTLHENGKSLRCRVVQTWQLTDGSTAHQLQAIDSGEMITILDDPITPAPSSRGMSKRIFHWGQANRTPPAGVPVPPMPRELMVDSGVVVNREINPPPPGGTVITTTAVGAGGAVAAVPSSPYPPSPYAGMGNTRTMPANPCECAPGGTIIAGSSVCPSQICDQGCVQGSAKLLPPPAPTLAGKVQNWFSTKAASPAATEVKVAAAPRPTTQENSLAIATPPSAAQASPYTPDIVHSAVKDSGGVGDWAAKPFVGISAASPTPASGDVAAAKSSGAAVDTPRISVPVAAKTDILATPEKFMPTDEKLKAKNVAVVPAKTVTATSVAAPTGLAPGGQSVLAARNGLDGPVAYIPIQPLVMPKPWRAPVPPDPKMPEAPQLNTYVNAFTPPGPPPAQNGPQFQGGAMMPYPPMMANGPYPGMMPPYATMNPYMPPQGMPYGYPMMPPWANAASSQRMYQGPVPPDPFGTNAVAPPMLQQVGYIQPPMPYPPMVQAPVAPVVEPTFAPAAPAAPTAAPAAQLAQLVDLLHDSPYPAQREMAANYLSACDWHANPQVAAALIDAAKQDPAPTVRAGCIANLARMSVVNEAFRRVLDEMRTDADPRVREAVEQAIMRLGQVQTSARTN